MLKVVFLRQPRKFIAKMSDDLYLKIQKEIDFIIENPERASKLTGKLKQVRSHHFFYKRSEYGIAYQVQDDLIIILISTRENFYNELLRKT